MEPYRLLQLLRTGLLLEDVRSPYHRALLSGDRLDRLYQALSVRIDPPSNTTYVTLTGSLRPAYPEERHCGPRSLVRDKFLLKLRMAAGEGTLPAVAWGEVNYVAKKDGWDVDSVQVSLEVSTVPWEGRAFESLAEKIFETPAPAVLSYACPLCGGALQFSWEICPPGAKGCFRVSCQSCGERISILRAAEKPPAWTSALGQGGVTCPKIP